MQNSYFTWFISEDIAYFQNVDILKLEFNLPTKILIMPNEYELKQALLENETFSVISTSLPNYAFQNLFIVKHLPNKYGILTTQEYLANVGENEALEKRLGLSVINSSFNLSNIGGAELLKKYTSELLKAEQKGYRAKAIFLVGIPGTGKTFFPKCFAGETNRLLIQLNLSLIMESAEPIAKLNSIFKYLDTRYKQNPSDKYVILIDEIEKMIGNASPQEKQMLGRLLTILNDINTPVCEYDFDAIFFATANNLNSILDNNPELLRRGRFDELFFINLPTRISARAVFEIYIKKFNLLEYLEKENQTIDTLILRIEDKYQAECPVNNKFPYTPAEIENFCKRLNFAIKANGELNEAIITESLEMIIPITLSAKDGIRAMVAQKKLFSEI